MTKSCVYCLHFKVLRTLKDDLTFSENFRKLWSQDMLFWVFDKNKLDIKIIRERVLFSFSRPPNQALLKTT